VSLFLPIVLPGAVVLARRAAREAAASGGEPWRRRIIDRPILLYLVTWFVFFALAFVLFAVGS
jgi:hypothetical protein